MTREDALWIEEQTHWSYHVKADGRDEKFVIQRQGTRGDEYRELVLKLRQCGPVLVYWTGGNRDRIQQAIVQVLNVGLPVGTRLLPAIPHAENDDGHVFNLLIENIPPEEFVQHLDRVRAIVIEMRDRLRNNGFLN